MNVTFDGTDIGMAVSRLCAQALSTIATLKTLKLHKVKVDDKFATTLSQASPPPQVSISNNLCAFRFQQQQQKIV